MKIVKRKMDTGLPADPSFHVAQILARRTSDDFGAVRGARAGIADGSCCASVAVVPNGGYLAVSGADVPATLPAFSMVYGNSRFKAGGLVEFYEDIGSHAERAALTIAERAGLTLLNIGGKGVLYVELEPCGPCKRWLDGEEMSGAKNPYNASGITIDVWYKWDYPSADGIARMKEAHRDETVS